MSPYLLTIIIPTLDRLELLKVSLGALLKQVEPYKDKIEFVVVNYISKDATAEWLEANYKNHPILKFTNIYEKIGIVESVMLCIEMAKGKYVWVFGDDDLPMPFAVETVIRTLQNSFYENLDILYFNSIRSDVKMKQYTSVYDGRVELEPTILSTDDFVNQFHLNLGLIITLVFKQSNWVQGKSFYKKEYYGYGWIAPLIAGSKNGKCLYYPFPISVHRVGGQRYVNKWPLYILVGVPSMFHDFRKEGILQSNPLKTWQKTYSFLDFTKVLIVAKAFNYGHNHFLWRTALLYTDDTKKRIVLQMLRYMLPPALAQLIFNTGATIKETLTDEKLS